MSVSDTRLRVIASVIANSIASVRPTPAERGGLRSGGSGGLGRVGVQTSGERLDKPLPPFPSPFPPQACMHARTMPTRARKEARIYSQSRVCARACANTRTRERAHAHASTRKQCTHASKHECARVQTHTHTSTGTDGALARRLYAHTYTHAHAHARTGTRRHRRRRHLGNAGEKVLGAHGEALLPLWELVRRLCVLYASVCVCLCVCVRVRAWAYFPPQLT